MSETAERNAPTPTALAEASAWLARLMRPNRTPDIDAGFQRWLAESPEHSAAFEHTQDAWSSTDGLVRQCVRPRIEWRSPRAARKRWLGPLVISVAVASVTVVVAAFLIMTAVKGAGDVTTGIGERAAKVLSDGTRVELNTDTQLRVEYTQTERRVRLNHGEALFAVAKNANYPFIVIAGDKTVTALGTQFLVRNDAHQLSVTLVEGKVSIASAIPAVEGAPAEKTTFLIPGERFVVDTGNAAVIDRPALDRVQAWQHGEVSLDDTPLADAVAEMNRYSTQRLVIEDPRTASIHVTGIFRAGDSLSFARAVEHTYQIQVVEDAREIRLVGSPRVQPPQ